MKKIPNQKKTNKRSQVGAFSNSLTSLFKDQSPKENFSCSLVLEEPLQFLFSSSPVAAFIALDSKADVKRLNCLEEEDAEEEPVSFIPCVTLALPCTTSLLTYFKLISWTTPIKPTKRKRLVGNSIGRVTRRNDSGKMFI